MPRNSKRRSWTSSDVRTLKTMARKKTRAASIARTLKLSTEVAIVGAACLFLNWIVTKQYLYFTVQTDTTAFSLGVAAALCAIERRFFSLAIVAVISATVFASAVIISSTSMVSVSPLSEPYWA